MTNGDVDVARWHIVSGLVIAYAGASVTVRGETKSVALMIEYESAAQPPLRLSKQQRAPDTMHTVEIWHHAQ